MERMNRSSSDPHGSLASCGVRSSFHVRLLSPTEMFLKKKVPAVAV